MSYRLTINVCGVKIKDEIREGTPKLDIAGFLRDMKNLGIKTTVGIDYKGQQGLCLTEMNKKQQRQWK